MQDFILMFTEVSHPPSKLVEKTRQWEQGAGEQQLSQAEASPARAAVLGCLDPGRLLMHGLPLSARKKSANLAQKERYRVPGYCLCISNLIDTATPCQKE